MSRKPTYEELRQRIKDLEESAAAGRGAEGVLRKSEDIKQLLKFAPYGIYLTDLPGRVILANQRGAEHFGKTVEGLVDTALGDYFPPEIRENWRLKDVEVLQSAEPMSFEDEAGGKWYQPVLCPTVNPAGLRRWLQQRRAKSVTCGKDCSCGAGLYGHPNSFKAFRISCPA